MRNFKYIDTIKKAVESECPQTVSCADIVVLSARDGFELVCICWKQSHNQKPKQPWTESCAYVLQLGGPYIEMKTGRRDSKESYATVVEDSIPNHNDSMSLVLSRFQSIGIDAEGTVALLGMWLSQSTVYPLYILDFEGVLYMNLSIMSPWSRSSLSWSSTLCECRK